MNTGKLLLGVLGGVAAGALLGVLIAPDKGSETRKKISKKGSEAIDELKGQFDDMVSSLTDKFDAVKEDLTELYEKGKQKTDEFKRGVKSEMS